MKQPEPLRSLYEITNNIADYNTVLVNLGELRRLHEVNQELLAALKEISSGTYDTWSEGYRAQQIAIASLAKVEKQK